MQKIHWRDDPKLMAPLVFGMIHVAWSLHFVLLIFTISVNMNIDDV